jgi:hypothetical protein
MSTIALATPSPAFSLSPDNWLSELTRRQPQLAATSQLFLLATLPCLMAMMIDPRTVNDISGWIKPAKFFLSLSLYYATLTWFFGYLPTSIQRTLAGRFVIWAPIVAGLLEMAWMIAAAANGVASHFNRADPLWLAAYRAAGIVVLVLMLALPVQGFLLARHRSVPIPATFRLSLVLGSLIAFATTLVLGGYLAFSGGHWVGGGASDAGGLPITGWSRTGGDLRVAHFWAPHAHQLVPLAGWLIVRSRMPAPTFAAWTFAIAYTGFVVFTFVQALEGRPFIG